MRRAEVFMQEMPAGILEEFEKGGPYRFSYSKNYSGLPISLTMPVEKKEFFFHDFPPFFDGLLPEGIMLKGFLKQQNIDQYDYFSQLVAVGINRIGAVSVREIK